MARLVIWEVMVPIMSPRQCKTYFAYCGATGKNIELKHAFITNDTTQIGYLLTDDTKKQVGAHFAFCHT